MSLWSRIFGAREQKAGTIEDWFAEFGWPNRSAGGLSVNQVTAMQVSTVMSCVSILSEDVAKLPVHVYRRQDNGGKKIILDHPIETLLQRPNDYQSKFEFFEQMMCSLLLRGNAYAPIIRDGRGRPIGLIPVNPDRVWIYEAPDGSIFYMTARRGPHDIAVLKSLPLMIPAEDMLHLRWLAMDNSLWGISRIGLARESIALAISQQELSARLSGNNTNLGGVLQTDQKLNDQVIERLRRNWKERYSGLRNAGETAVLEQGLKWQPLGMTAQDAEFLASRNFQVLEICRLFRMPPHKVGVTERMAGAQLEQLDQDYMNNTVSSYLERIENKVSQQFGLAEEGVFIEFDVSRFLRASMQTRLNALGTGVVRMIYTPNEARRAEGLPDVEGGDVLYQPVNVAPIGFVPAAGTESGPGSDATGLPAEGGRGDPAAPDAPGGAETPGSPES